MAKILSVSVRVGGELTQLDPVTIGIDDERLLGAIGTRLPRRAMNSE